MNKEYSIWNCNSHGEFRTRTKGRPRCPVCKSVKVHFIGREDDITKKGLGE